MPRLTRALLPAIAVAVVATGCQSGGPASSSTTAAAGGADTPTGVTKLIVEKAGASKATRWRTSVDATGRVLRVSTSIIDGTGTKDYSISSPNGKITTSRNPYGGTITSTADAFDLKSFDADGASRAALSFLKSRCKKSRTGEWVDLTVQAFAPGKPQTVTSCLSDRDTPAETTIGGQKITTPDIADPAKAAATFVGYVTSFGGDRASELRVSRSKDDVLMLTWTAGASDPNRKTLQGKECRLRFTWMGSRAGEVQHGSPLDSLCSERRASAADDEPDVPMSQIDATALGKILADAGNGEYMVSLDRSYRDKKLYWSKYAGGKQSFYTLDGTAAPEPAY